jgi:hypothetical protein
VFRYRKQGPAWISAGVQVWEDRVPPGLQYSKYRGQGKAYIPGIQDQRIGAKLYSINPVIENEAIPLWEPLNEE